MSYIQHHKYLLLAFFALILVSGISGYLSFTTHDSQNTTGEEIQDIDSTTQDEIQITEEEITIIPSSLEENQQDEVKTNTTTTPTLEIPHSEFQNPITLKVSGEEYNTELKPDTTVYELMQNLSASSVKSFIFSGKDYSAGMGYFVTGINGIKNDPQTGKYWIYYINGESAKIGISNYIINKGDIIEWKYENSNM